MVLVELEARGRIIIPSRPFLSSGDFSVKWCCLNISTHYSQNTCSWDPTPTSLELSNSSSYYFYFWDDLGSLDSAGWTGMGIPWTWQDCVLQMPVSNRCSLNQATPGNDICKTYPFEFAHLFQELGGFVQTLWHSTPCRFMVYMM